MDLIMGFSSSFFNHECDNGKKLITVTFVLPHDNLREALSSHFNCDLCGKNTISDNVLGEHNHIEFYSDTEAFSTHSNCDLCGKYTFWNSTMTQRRETILTPRIRYSYSCSCSVTEKTG